MNDMPIADTFDPKTNRTARCPTRLDRATARRSVERVRRDVGRIGSATRALLVCMGLLSGLLLSNCASAPTSQVPESPLLIGANFAAPPYYRVEANGGSELLLLGTIHVGPASGWQLSPAVLEGLERANRIVLEIDLREATEDAVSSVLAETVVLQPPDTLPTVVGPETNRLLEALDPELTRLGMPVNARLRLEPWFIAMGLIEIAAQRSGYSADAALENQILAGLDARPILPLETFREQIAMLDELPRDVQDAMLRDTLMRLDTATRDLQELADAWRRGDEAELERLSRIGTEDLPKLDELYDVLLGDRNRRWMRTLRALLDASENRGETVLVAVGALHLVGEDGLVDLLREAGYSVSRVDHFRRLEAESGNVRR